MFESLLINGNQWFPNQPMIPWGTLARDPEGFSAAATCPSNLGCPEIYLFIYIYKLDYIYISVDVYVYLMIYAYIEI